MGNQSKSHNIKARKRLAALYEKGIEVRFTEDGPKRGPFEEPLAPDDESTVAVWMSPPSPLHREMAMRDASAARSRAVLAAKSNPDSDEAVVTKAFLKSLSLDSLVDFVLTIDESERQEEAQREVLAEEEWKDFTELQDSMRQWDEAGNPRTDEWMPLVERDLEFGRQVREVANRIRGDALASLKQQARGDLEQMAFDKRVDMVGTQAFVALYEDHMLFYSCRDVENHSEMFFEDVDDMKSMPEEVTKELAETITDFIEDPREAKNSQGAASGSQSSDLPAEPETSEPSTPEAVTT